MIGVVVGVVLGAFGLAPIIPLAGTLAGVVTNLVVTYFVLRWRLSRPIKGVRLVAVRGSAIVETFS